MQEDAEKDEKRREKTGFPPEVIPRCLRQRQKKSMIKASTERKEENTMLNENLKIIRKSKNMSQEELAIRLNVVRQTVSKWEQGLSVPDADLLIALSEVLETPVSVLLGESVREQQTDGGEDVKELSEKLEEINLQLARMKDARRKKLHLIFLILTVLTGAVTAFLFFWGSPYLAWDYGDPETAAAGAILHGFEFVFVRLAPFLLIGGIVGAVMTRKRR